MTERVVTVAFGESLWSIADRTLGSGRRWPDVFALNATTLRDPSALRVGQVLQVPDGDRFGASDPHPLQRARPSIPMLSAPAGSARGGSAFTALATGTPRTMSGAMDFAANLVPNMAPHQAMHGRMEPPQGSNPVLRTIVNPPAIRFDLASVPAIVSPVATGYVRTRWGGIAFLWRDTGLSLSAVANKCAEIGDKQGMAMVLADLLESRTLALAADRTITYEDAMSAATYGLPVTMVSDRPTTITQSSPVSTTRVRRRLVQGKVRDTLFIVHDLVVTFDIETTDATGRPPASQFRAPYPGRLLADTTTSRPTLLQSIGRWTPDAKRTIIDTASARARSDYAYLTLGGTVASNGLGPRASDAPMRASLFA